MLSVASLVYEEPLITVGDAIESFIVVPDKLTKGRCLTTKREQILNRSPGSRRTSIDSPPRLWLGTRRRWFSAASELRWSFGVSFFIVALAVVATLLNWAISSLLDARSLKTL